MAMYMEFVLGDGDIKALKELSDTLEPLKSAVLMLSKKDATIWDSERILELTISELQSSESQISKELLGALCERSKA